MFQQLGLKRFEILERPKFGINLREVRYVVAVLTSFAAG